MPAAVSRNMREETIDAQISALGGPDGSGGRTRPGAGRLSQQARHRGRAVRGRRPHRRRRPPGGRAHVAHARPAARGRERGRCRRHHRHDARGHRHARRLHPGRRQHGHAVGGACALSQPQVRPGQELRADRPVQFHSPGDRRQEGHRGARPQGLHRLPQGQQHQTELRARRRRLHQPRVRHPVQRPVRAQARARRLSRHGACAQRPRRRSDRLHGRPIPQRHPADQGRDHQGLRHRCAGAAGEPSRRADHQGAGGGLHLLGMERHGRPQGHAQGDRRQAIRRARQGARRCHDQGALCRARQHCPAGRRSRPGRFAEAGRERDGAHHARAQGSSRSRAPRRPRRSNARPQLSRGAPCG